MLQPEPPKLVLRSLSPHILSMIHVINRGANGSPRPQHPAEIGMYWLSGSTPF